MVGDETEYQQGVTRHGKPFSDVLIAKPRLCFPIAEGSCSLQNICAASKIPCWIATVAIL